MIDNNTTKPSSSECIRELKIDTTLWAAPAKIINLLNFKQEKLVLILIMIQQSRVLQNV